MTACVVVGGCTVGPDYTRPEDQINDAWAGPDDGLIVGDPATLVVWWEGFEDPALTELIERAATANKDVRRSIARIEEARARAGVARGQRYPQIDAFAKYDRFRNSEQTADPAPKSDGSNNYAFGLDASWEVDVFGRLRRAVEAAEADWQASWEDYRDVSVSLFADVAVTYFEFRTLQARLAVARRNVASQTGSLELARARFDAELVSELDVTQAEALLAETEATIPALDEAIERASNRLSVLLGEQPGSLTPMLSVEEPIPPAPDGVLVATPGDVIRHRPDIRRAERELAAQTARVGVATAELYPRFSIVGSFGFDSKDAGSNLFDMSARSFSVGPRVRVPIFNAGRLRSLVDAEDARAQQALHTYEQAVLTGLEEAENAIVAIVRERERGADLTRAVEASGRSQELADELYRAGLADYQRVLDALRATLASEDAAMISVGRQAASVAELYRAFGGGWRYADDVLGRQGLVQGRSMP